MPSTQGLVYLTTLCYEKSLTVVYVFTKQRLNSSDLFNWWLLQIIDLLMTTFFV